MIEVKNKKKYYPYIVKITLWLLAGFVAVQLWNPVSLWVALLLFSILELIIVSTRFTQSIIINPSKVIISYHHFFTEKQLVIPTSEVEFKLTKTASLRSPEYFVLSVLKNKKKVYQVDSRDGFEEQDLYKITEFKESTSS